MVKILIAEDEMIERKVLCKTLHKHLGEECTLLEAKNGREAIALFEAEEPQVAILDIEMPGINGLEAARRIRESGKPCVILFLTAFDKFSYAREAISLRALDYLLKPYDEKELILTVEEAIHILDRLTRPGPRQLSAEGILAGEGEEPDKRISQVRDDIERYIQKHFADELSMQDVAQAMNYSDAYFCKLFKQCFKVNFSAYLNEYRVEKAKELLTVSRASVREISEQCGYSDSNYFTRVFKRITGMTPSEYRVAN